MSVEELRFDGRGEHPREERRIAAMPFPCLMPKYPSLLAGNGDLSLFLQDFYLLPKTDLETPLPGISAILSGLMILTPS